ncbi:MAG: Uncharacterised protein [Cyanobium sp. ARS6]|nr:MAG: Uncharacterised protein [Cyanobium sp. ARS6]
MQSAETVGIRCLRFFKVAHRPLTEEETEHGADTSRCDGQTSSRCCLLDASDQFFSGCGEFVVAARLFQELKSLDARRHGEGISAQSAGLVHGTGRSHHLHDFPSTSVGPHRQPPADHLAHGGEIRGDTEMRLGAAVTDAEARHHFVEDEQSSVLLGEFAQTLEEPRLRLDESCVANDGFKNDT